MKVGIYFDMRNPPPWQRPWPEHYAENLELVEEAERLGASSVWLSEHHFFEDGYLPQPLTFAAAIAARTSRIHIGTAILLLALRPAIQVAEEAAIVDILSNGRLELGVGVGYRVPEFEGFGQDISKRYELVDQKLGELLAIWQEGRATPPPVNNPVHMWGGFFGPRGAKIAGRHGLGLLALTPELLAPYRQGLIDGGHDPAMARARGHMPVIVSDDPEAAWPRIKEHLEWQENSYRFYWAEGTEHPTPKPIDPDRYRLPGPNGEPPRFAILTPEDAAARVRQTIGDMPAEEVFFWTSVSGMPRDLVERHVQLLCTEVAPLLADAGISSTR